VGQDHRRLEAAAASEADAKAAAVTAGAITSGLTYPHAASVWHKDAQMNISELDRWDSFYVIVGSAAGALIGLQFVVITLIAERPPLRAAEAGSAFATPTIVYFSTTLLLSALQRVPWPSIHLAAILWGLVGLGGVVYAVIVARRMRVQTVYQPEFEDWCFHLLLPLGAYAMLALSALTATSYVHEALFGVAAAALLLLFIGIHNTWDSLVYHVFSRRSDANPDRRDPPGK
jgi:hypothetical protein